MNDTNDEMFYHVPLDEAVQRLITRLATLAPELTAQELHRALVAQRMAGWNEGIDDYTKQMDMPHNSLEQRLIRTEKLFTNPTEGGPVVHICEVAGAGTMHGKDNIVVYMDGTSGQMLYRTAQDFADSMQMITVDGLPQPTHRSEHEQRH